MRGLLHLDVTAPWGLFNEDFSCHVITGLLNDLAHNLLLDHPGGLLDDNLTLLDDRRRDGRGGGTRYRIGGDGGVRDRDLGWGRGDGQLLRGWPVRAGILGRTVLCPDDGRVGRGRLVGGIRTQPVGEQTQTQQPALDLVSRHLAPVRGGDLEPPRSPAPESDESREGRDAEPGNLLGLVIGAELGQVRDTTRVEQGTGQLLEHPEAPEVTISTAGVPSACVRCTASDQPVWPRRSAKVAGPSGVGWSAARRPESIGLPSRRGIARVVAANR